MKRQIRPTTTGVIIAGKMIMTTNRSSAVLPRTMKAMVHYGMEASLSAALMLEKYAQGALVHSVDIDLPAPVMMHDLIITEDGKPESIVSFEAIELPEEPAPARPLLRLLAADPASPGGGSPGAVADRAREGEPVPHELLAPRVEEKGGGAPERRHRALPGVVEPVPAERLQERVVRSEGPLVAPGPPAHTPAGRSRGASARRRRHYAVRWLVHIPR